MEGPEPLVSSLFQVGLVSALMVEVVLLSTRDGEHDTKARNGRLVTGLLGCYTVRIDARSFSSYTAAQNF